MINGWREQLLLTHFTKVPVTALDLLRHKVIHEEEDRPMLTDKKSDESGSDVPHSERGKGENMHLDEKSPSAVFGIVGLTYLVVLILLLLGVALWMYL